MSVDEFAGPKELDGTRETHPLLQIEDLQTSFDTRDGMVRAVNGVDLSVRAGETLCVVGESGCGKSVSARSVLGLVDSPGEVTGGRVWWHSDRFGRIDLASLDQRGSTMRAVRATEIGMVSQEPVASLSPMYSVGAQLEEVLRLHKRMSKDTAREHAIHLLSRVGIPRPETRIDAYPWQMSGGMCQRVMIAMALAGEPGLLIADEPTTALDVTIQAQILDLFARLQEETGMAVLFITHDLGVVAEIADEVAVMYLGRVVERGSVSEIFENPRHPYTRALMRSIPHLGSHVQGTRLPTVRGQVPHGARRPSGCSFHPRCEVAIAGLCDGTEPRVIREHGHLVECHRWDADLLPQDVELGLPPLEQLGVDAAGVAVEGTVGAEESTTMEDNGACAGSRPPVDTEQTGLSEDADPGAAPESVDTTDAAPAPVDATHAGGTSQHPLLQVKDLVMQYPVKSGLFGRQRGQVHALSGVDLAIRRGETLGLVGESGCGKTTLGRCVVRSEQPTSGEVLFHDGSDVVDLAAMRQHDLRPYQRRVRMIFQDPFSSLNPRMTLRQIIGDPLVAHRIAKGDELTDRVADMLERVGLSPDYMDRYPHAFSGGQRQRVNIARALILEPELVVADEAVSALDVSVRAQILNLLRDLQEQMNLTYLFISHDLSVVESVCDRVAVMYLGRVVELADTAQVFHDPQHPYTEALLSAVPVPDPALRDAGRRIRLSDDLPDPMEPPAGCYFHTRCHYAVKGLCDRGTTPDLERAETPSHDTACFRHRELNLIGIDAGSNSAGGSGVDRFSDR